MAKDRTPKVAASPSGIKQPKAHATTSYNDLHPSWRFDRIDWKHPFVDFEVTSDHLKDLFESLCQLEQRDWNEILVASKKQNHNVEIEKLSKKAQDRLGMLFKLLDFDQLLSLRLSAKERIWGVLDRGVVTLLWWDPKHEVCPSAPKNT